MGSPTLATALNGDGETAAPAVFGRVLPSDTFTEGPAAPPGRASMMRSVVHGDEEAEGVVDGSARSNSANFSLRFGLSLWDFERPSSLSITIL